MKNQKPTLVFLHGVGLDSSMWNSVSDMLPPETVYLDLLGHRNQPKIPKESSLQELSDDIAARLPNGKIQLVGFSLGGLIAQRLAIDLPEKIISMVAASTVCQRTTEERASVRARLATARADFKVATEHSLERWYPAGTQVPPKVVQHSRTVLERNDVESFLNAYEVFAEADQEIGTELEKLQQPLLAITGEFDAGSTPQMSQRIAQTVRNGTLHIVAGARHMLPHEKPEEFAHKIKHHFKIEDGLA